MTNPDFARTLSLLRQEKGISQRQAAKALGISQALLSHYENGAREPGLVFVGKACDFYNVSVDFLLGRTLSRDGTTILDADTLYDVSDERDNVLRGSVLATLSNTAQNDLANLITLLLGITISFSMKADQFVRPETLMIMGLGLFAFVFDSIGGVLFAKLLNLFSKEKINPMIGAAGISAFPMASRVVHKMGLEEDAYNFLLMHAAGANVSGQIASVIAGGLMITLVENML